MFSRVSVAIGLMSLSLVAMELTWTRIFSAEFFYSFAFLILSLAVLGLGLGALALRLVPLLARASTAGWYLLGSAILAVAGPVAILHLGLEFRGLLSQPAMVLRLTAAVMILGSSYFLGGVALALLFRRHHTQIARLYMADLVGAGLGVAIVLLLMNGVGVPAAVLLSALPLLVASTLLLSSWKRLIPILGAVATMALVPKASTLLDSQRDEPAPLIYRHWDALARLKVWAFDESYRALNIDGVANTGFIAFDGDFDKPELKEEPWGVNVSFLIHRFESCRFLSLGAGGGADVLQALTFGAAEVHAVEVNPHINRMLLEGDPAGYLEPPIMRVKPKDGAEPPSLPTLRDESGELITTDRYTGHLYRDPRVRVVSEDARTYVRRHREAFDVIYSLSTNSWAALGSGSFAYTESYIFTVEAFRDYWRALSDEGFLVLEHQIYVPRLVGASLEALAAEGVGDPARHLAVYDLPSLRRNVMLLSKAPLTDELRAKALGELSPDQFDKIHLLYPPADGAEGNLVERIVRDGWRSAMEEAAIDVSPVSDDRPFVAQTGRWRNFSWEGLSKSDFVAELRGFPLSNCILVAILAVVTLLVVPLNVAPYLTRGEHLPVVPWLYFFAIGVAFMAAEVVLIQKYSLFIGASIYSIATVLLTLLLSAGLGSRISGRVSTGLAFAAIVAGLVFHAFAAHWVIDALCQLALPARVAATAALIAPLGFFMGMPFPKAALAVGPLVDWGFAVNGAASVLGGTGILLVAFSAGFGVALSVAALFYVAAYGLIRYRKAWPQSRA